jgi:hypothetical protein
MNNYELSRVIMQAVGESARSLGQDFEMMEYDGQLAQDSAGLFSSMKMKFGQRIFKVDIEQVQTMAIRQDYRRGSASPINLMWLVAIGVIAFLLNALIGMWGYDANIP